MKQEKKNFDCIDCTKFTMALAVVAIHVEAVAKVTYTFLIEWFINLAVPFFFIASAYLLGKKLNRTGNMAEQEHILRNRYRKIFRIFLCWIIIYLPITIYKDIYNPFPLWYDIASYFRTLLLAGESAYAWPLWFLYSMGIILFIFSRLLKYKYSKAVLFLLFGLCIYFKWFTSVCHEIPGLPVRLANMVINRPIGGGMYMVAGLFLSDYSERTLRSPLTGSVLIGVSMILCFFRLPFWELAGGAGIFLVAVRIKMPECPVYKTLRNQSMWIYYTHMYVICAILMLCPQLYKEELLFPVFCAVCLVIWTLSLLLNRLAHTGRFQWLRHLIG